MYAGVIGASNRITGRRRRIRHSSPQTAPDRAVDRTRARGDLAALCTPLDAQPALTAAVQQDLEAGFRTNARKGRAKLAGEQMLRPILVRRLKAWTYIELAFHLLDVSSGVKLLRSWECAILFRC